MIAKSRASSKDMTSLRVGDEIELELYHYQDNNKKLRVMVKVTSFIKEPVKCGGCGIILKGKAYEFNKRLYCNDCFLLRKEESSKRQMGHPRYGNEFGGTVTIGKGRD